MKIIEEFMAIINEYDFDTNHSIGTEVNPYHVEGTVLTHTMMVVNEANKLSDDLNQDEKDALIFSALFHDCGKVLAREVVYSEKYKKHIVRFTGHEGIGFFRAYDLINAMKKNVKINDFVLKATLYSVAKHGHFYNNLNHENFLVKSQDEFSMMRVLLRLCISDVKGRISFVDSSKYINGIIEAENNISLFDDHENSEVENKQKVILAVGIPGSGKSYYYKSYYNNSNNWICISFDEEIMSLPGKDYSEKWNYMNKNKLGNELMQRAIKKYIDALKTKKNVYVDMTNLTKKSRRRWINSIPRKLRDRVFVEALVFNRGLNSSIACRCAKGSEKYVSKDVIYDMAKRFYFPVYIEGIDRIRMLF